MSDRGTHFMKLALHLAERGKSWVSPNPMVGCVIVRKGIVVGRGYHRRYGESHAEVNALRDAGEKARGAALYVNLEPCVHHGKTPPCTEAIIQSGVRYVVVSTRDPNPLVNGKGLRELRKAGIRVTTGLLRTESRQLNEKFVSAMETGLPFVGAKIAQTLDGRIADFKGRSKWISSVEARSRAHQLRSEYASILAGWKTIEMDNPALTVRHARGRSPVRIVLDGAFNIGPGYTVCNTSEAPTMVITSSASLQKNYQKALALERKGVQVIGIRSGKTLDPVQVLRVLKQAGLTSVLIEGGSATLRPFFEGRLVRRVHCFVAPTILGSGTPGFSFGRLALNRSVRLNHPTISELGETILLEGSLQYR